MTARKTKPDEPRRDPNDRPLKPDKRVSLAPLDFEQALKGLLQAGPHVEPEDGAPESAEDKEKAPRKGRRQARDDAPDTMTP
jgi:hypothetical protein